MQPELVPPNALGWKITLKAICEPHDTSMPRNMMKRFDRLDKRVFPHNTKKEKHIKHKN